MMLQWGLQVDTTCLLCNLHTKSRDHLYFHCCYSFYMWSMIARRCRITPRRAWDETVTQMQALLPQKAKRLLTLLSWQETLYWIQNERNSRMHTITFRSVDAFFTIIHRQIRNKTQSFRDSKPTLYSAMFQRWIDIAPWSASSWTVSTFSSLKTDVGESTFLCIIQLGRCASHQHESS